MKLRTYLIKRTTHMIITLLIVLVLLFVLYRMMPGSAAAQMMMNPMMTENEINLVLVRYGFGRWVDYPGQYTVTNFQPQDIGRYEVVVSAETEDGQTGSFETHFDVNAPDTLDLLAPVVLDVGLETPPAIGDHASLYIKTYDEGAIRSVDVVMTAPNHVLDENDNLVQYTETISLFPVANLTDEAANIYYYAGTSTVLEAGESGDANFTFQFDVEDRGWNVGTAVMGYDASTGLETGKMWNISTNIGFANGQYTYPDISDDVSFNLMSTGGTPTYSILMPNMVDSDAVTMSATSIADQFSGSYETTQNGIMTFQAEMDGMVATYTFPVNSQETMPASVDGPSSGYPELSNLHVTKLNPNNGREMPDAEYPFVLSDLKLLINATAIDSDGERCSNVTATITRPDGGQSVTSLSHPRLVEMRTMAEQFVIYMKTMLVFDFGTSYMYQRPSWEVLLERVPSTVLLFGTALVLSYVVGISVGVLVAWRRGTVFEMSTIVVTLFFYSMPIFWFALIMQWIFYSQLGWFPLGGVGGIDSDGNPMHGLVWFSDILWHLAMPLVTLMILGLAGNILLMRSAMLEVIGEDFTTTAKAKGLKERTVIYKHVARNAMLPVVTSMAMSIGSIISGGVLTETIFSWYGMGTLLIEATLTKDFPVVQGAFYILALITILGNMAADLLYAWLDPRVQL